MILGILLFFSCSSESKEKETEPTQQKTDDGKIKKSDAEDVDKRMKFVESNPNDFITLVDVSYDKNSTTVIPQNVILKNTSEFDVHIFTGRFNWSDSSGSIGSSKIRFLGADRPGLWLPPKGQNEISSDFFEADSINKKPTKVEFVAGEISVSSD